MSDKRDLYKTCVIRGRNEIVGIKSHEYRENIGEHWFLVHHKNTHGRKIWWPESCLKHFVL